MKKNIIIIISVVVLLLIGGAVVYFSGWYNGKIKRTLSAQEAAEKAVNFINQNKENLTGGMTASLVSAVEENGLYKIKIKIGENEFESYVSKDGKFLFPSAINLEPETTKNSQEQNNTAAETQKRDTPDVKLFVMSYCPYGLQSQKMFLPVYNLLKDKVNMGVYFVDYIMHGKQEIDENLRQYCIQKEQKEKYYNYLSCFVKAGEFEKCLSEANINKEKMNSCISQTDKKYKITENYNDKNTWLNGNFPRFDIYTDLNEKYGVQGSPTIVINDKIVEVNPRSPEKFKEVICNAFNNPPAECSQTLSSDAISPGFGESKNSSSNTSGGCGQ